MTAADLIVELQKLPPDVVVKVVYLDHRAEPYVRDPRLTSADEVFPWNRWHRWRDGWDYAL